jgi:hypothetical protein
MAKIRLNQSPVTVGALRQLLAEYHESDIVLVTENNLLHRVTVDKHDTAAGIAVVIERGERWSV